MRRTWLRRGALLLGTLAVGAVAFVLHSAQRADYGWRPRPLLKAVAARIAFDDGHHNGSSARWWGRYYPLARLLRAAGYRVEIFEGPFSAAGLRATDVLVVANASGAARPQFLGINIPLGAGGDRGAPAFTRGEIDALLRWVADGGRLLLVADHAPFGAANADLARAFGVEMHAGFTELPDESSDPMRFTRANGRLGSHPVLRGVACVQTFTGQSLDAAGGAVPLLRLPAGALEYVDDGNGRLQPREAGIAQGYAMRHGKGRVVVLGEAAMLTAQVADGQPFGMQLPGCDNQRFAERVFAWLAAGIPATSAHRIQ